MKNEKNGKLFKREAEEAAELVTDGSCCPTPFFFSTIQEQNEEKYKYNLQQNKSKMKNFHQQKNKMKKRHNFFGVPTIQEQNEERDK